MDLLVERIPAPAFEPGHPLQAQVTNLDASPYVGRLALCRVRQGTIKRGQTVAWCRANGTIESAKISELYVTDNLDRIETDEAGPGEIIAIAGIPEITIGETLADPDDPRPLPVISVDEPSLSVTIGINTSPLSGQDGSKVTARQLRNRLDAELIGNVSLRVLDTERPDTWEVQGRGELQLAVLVEIMRREGYELTVGKPQVLTQEIDGKLHEPVERVAIDVPEEYVGVVTQLLALRKGRMESLVNHGTGWVRMEQIVPARGLIGFRTEFLDRDPRHGPAAPRLRGLGAVVRRAAHPPDRRPRRRPPRQGRLVRALQPAGARDDVRRPRRRGLRGHDRRRERPLRRPRRQRRQGEAPHQPPLVDRRRARAPRPAAQAVARSGAGVPARGRVHRGDAERRAAAQGRAGPDQTAIAQFDRITPAGRLLPNAQPTTAATPGPANAIIVNPQGTRVLYGQAGSIVARPVIADGSLGAPVATPIPSGATTADVQSLAMTADGRSLYASDTSSGAARVWQFDVDPASGAIAPKSTPVVGWPGHGRPAAGGADGDHAVGQPPVPRRRLGRVRHRPLGDRPGDGSARRRQRRGAAVGRYAEGAVAISARRRRAVGAELERRVDVPRAHPPVRDRRGRRAHAARPAGRQLRRRRRGARPRPRPGRPDALPRPGRHGRRVGRRRRAAAEPPGERPAGPAGGVQNAGIALSPSRAPVAAFAAGQSLAGQATAFDASASNDPDGRSPATTGTSATARARPNAGPTPTHVYTSPGTRTVTLTVTDADGTSTAQLWTGTRMLRDGGPAARTTRVVTTATVPPLQPASPRPHKGQSVTVAAERGTILVRVPGSRRYVPIGSLTEIPLGSIIDARKGRARITAEVDARTGRTQSSLFYDWFFRSCRRRAPSRSPRRAW